MVGTRSRRLRICGKTKFADWLKSRITENAEFREGVDFCSTKLSSKTGSGGHNAKVALLTVSAARKIAMAEGGSVGNLVRDYYLWTEAKVEEAVERQPSGELSPVTLAASPAGCGRR